MNVRQLGWRYSVLGVTVACAVALAGCSSSGTGGGQTSPVSTPTVGATGSSDRTTSPAAPNTVAVSVGSSAPASTHHTQPPANIGPGGGPVPAHFTPTSVTFVSPDLGWVLGTAPCPNKYCTSVLRTRDGGHSWRGIPAPKASLGNPGDDRAEVAVLRFGDASNGWAGVGGLYSTHDGGASWHRQTLPHTPRESAVSSIEAGGGYVFATVDGCPSQGGSYCHQTSHLYASPISHDDWTEVDQTFPVFGARPGLVVHGADWFLPTRAGVYHGIGTGSVTHRANPCTTGGTAKLAAADSTHLDALCASGGAAGSSAYQLFGSTDGGRTWRRAGGQHRGPSGVTGIADNGKGVLLVSASSGASELLRTTDDGRSLDQADVHTRGGGIQWSDLGFTTTTQAVAVLDSTALYLSRDAGAHFAKVGF